MNKLAQTISLCKRAGVLILGFDVVKQSIQQDTADLILLASDISPKTEKEMMFILSKFDVEYLKIDLTLDELWYLLGKRAGVIAVTDQGLSNKIKTIVKSSPEL